jgi:hypothetical protein
MASSAGIPRRPEHRFAVSVAIIGILVLYAFLPQDLLGNIRYVVIGLVLVLLIPVVVLNPRRLSRETAWSRWLTLGLAIVITITNQITLVLLIGVLVAGTHQGPELLLAALEVWGTNVLGFALLFWELDRGGPVARHRLEREALRPADFRFPQDEDHDAIAEVAVRSSQKSGWVPQYIDYFYFSLSNSMAFSPTDTMPLSHRAKLFMALESFAGFVILALVIARGVSLIG